MRVVVTGGTGFVGCRLINQLLLDPDVNLIRVLSRSPDYSRNRNLNEVLRASSRADCTFEVVKWDPQNVTDELVEAIQGTDAVIHLAGTSIFQRRWNDSFKKELVDSRIISSRVLVFAIGKCTKRPRVLVSASGISYYGESGDNELDESTDAGNDFLAQLSVDWETEVTKAEEYGVRTCPARIGIVLGPEGGALLQMLPLFDWHIGGHVGTGQQWFPWIHADDCAAALLFAVKNSSVRGSFNNVSPNPVTMKEFCVELAKSKNRWSWAHAPYFSVRIILGEVAATITTSLRGVPRVLQENNFEWKYPTFEDALRNLIPAKN